MNVIVGYWNLSAGEVNPLDVPMDSVELDGTLERVSVYFRRVDGRVKVDEKGFVHY